jgi:hypothetical protein
LWFDDAGLRWGAGMHGQAGFFEVDERLKQLSAKGDSLERLNTGVDFELFRADLERAVPRSERAKGGRPRFDHVLMFKTLVLQTSHNLSDERTEYLIRDRCRSCGFSVWAWPTRCRTPTRSGLSAKR